MDRRAWRSEARLTAALSSADEGGLPLFCFALSFWTLARSAASCCLTLSGWSWRDFFLYALLMSSRLAERPTPRNS